MFKDTALSSELIQDFLETHYRVHQHGPDVRPLVLRVGLASASLAALHQAHGVDCSAFLTAFNPFAKQWDDAGNLKRQAELKQELSGRSLTFLAGIAEKDKFAPISGILEKKMETNHDHCT